MPPQGPSNAVAVELERDGERLARLARKKVFFGHQSVGNDILAGLRDLLAKRQETGIAVSEFDPAGSGDAPNGLVHWRIGKNGDPFSKIAAFERAILAERGKSRFDVAFFKFCYVDFYENTPVEQVFDAYKKAVSEIQAACPGLTIGHVTVPLTDGKPTWKERFKAMLGKSEIEYVGNVRRNRFNDLLRAEYGGTRTFLFDLARLESTRPDGSRATFSLGGRTYEVLAEEYTDDGGHLNVKGRTWVGGGFLQFLLATVEGRR